MIFKYITLTLEVSDKDFSSKEAYPFFLESRALCSFVERYIRPFKINTEGFNQLGVRAFKTAPEVQVYINSCQVLCVRLGIGDEVLSSMKGMGKKDINEFYISFLNEGLEQAKEYPLLVTQITEAINAFREADYINRWVYKRKRIVGRKAFCLIECEVTTDNFVMDLVVIKDDVEIYRKNIIEERPDELITDQYFGSLELKGDNIIVSGKRNKLIYTESIDRLFEMIEG